MITENKIQKLLTLLTDCDACILYKQLKDEVDYDSLINKNNLEKIILPNSKDFDPFELAEFCKNKFKNKKVFILIPGRSFDQFGTRHGRGGGWYDRFLSAVPREWLRVGITNKENFKDVKLERQNWDEQMDWVVIYDGEFFGWEV